MHAWQHGIRPLFPVQAMALSKPGSVYVPAADDAAATPMPGQHAGASRGPPAADSNASLGILAEDRGLLTQQQHCQQQQQQQHMATLLMQSAVWPGAAVPSAEPASDHATTEWSCEAEPLAPSPPARVSVAPAQPLRSKVMPPTGHTAHGNPTAGKTTARPGTAVACSLRSNVPPRIAAMLAEVGRNIASRPSPRPATAPASRPTTSTMAAPVAACGPSLHVTRRSLAGQQQQQRQQQGPTAGRSVSGVQAVIVRSATARLQGALLAQHGSQRGN